VPANHIELASVDATTTDNNISSTTSEFAGSSSGGIKEEPLQQTISRLENCKIPVVAVIHGFALGGGFEVALGCHYRVANADAQLGLPEVNLGLLPGAGGTQRLPRLIGALASANMILSGAPIKAEQALKFGVVDAILKDKTPEGRLKEAIAFVLTKKNQPRPVANMSVPDASQPDILVKLDAAYKSAMAKRRGEIAPDRIINCVKAAVTCKTFQEGMDEEARLFGQLLVSPESRALQHIFFAERACAKLPKEYNVEPSPVKKVGIVGSGLMGGGIAMCCVDVGIPVVLLDVNQDFLDRGFNAIRKNYSRSVERKSITQAQMDKRMSLLTGTLSYSDFKDCDIVIEAVFEDMKIKKEIFGKLDQVCKPGCILATNTSGLNIDDIAAATKRPQDVVGAHFFSPANVMKLLENVKGKQTSARVISTAMDFGKRINKVAILVGNCPGL
jgi:3-hydroxyacyl-CoA dehydrogenase